MKSRAAASIASVLGSSFRQAVDAAFPGISASIPISVMHASHNVKADYQCNNAFQIAKSAKVGAPAEIAAKIVNNLPKVSWIDSCAISPQGFININLASSALSQHVNEVALSGPVRPSLPESKKVLVDFASPNMCKALHVGHLRSIVLGDALSRLFEFCGHDVSRISHVGDWGTPVAMVIQHVLDANLATNYQPSRLELVQWYQEAKTKFDGDEAFKQRVYETVGRLQRQDERVVPLWNNLCDASRREFQEIFGLLGVNVKERGESTYAAKVPSVLQELIDKRLIERSQGALVYGVNNKIPLLLQKSDGTSLYATTDVATLKTRIEEGYKQIVYVTDKTQMDHFKLIFEIGQAAGWVSKEHSLHHVTFGVVQGSNHRKLSSRDGTSLLLIDLLKQASEEAHKVLTASQSILYQSSHKTAAAADGQIVDWRGSVIPTDGSGPNIVSPSKPQFTEEELSRTADAIGFGAVRYYDLCQRGDYVYNIASILSWRGNTSVYLLYAVSRIRGILEAAGDRNKLPDFSSTPVSLDNTHERDLALHLARFSESVERAMHELSPAIICDYLNTLARKFHSFYENCQVIGSPSESSRLTLCAATHRTLKEGLTLLGVPIVEKM